MKTESTTGPFIAIEGIDGSGKSTQTDYVVNWMASRFSTDVIKTREPGGSPSAEAVRELVLSGDHDWDAMTQLLLMFAARNEHLKQTIEPALAAGKPVVTDRYLWSSYAYQGAAAGLEISLIDRLTRLTGVRQPDIVILLDLEPGVAMQRVRERGADNALDSKPASFYKACHEAFQTLAHSARSESSAWPTCIVVDAAQSPDQVSEQIARALATHFSPKNPIKRLASAMSFL